MERRLAVESWEEKCTLLFCIVGLINILKYIEEGMRYERRTV